MTTAMQMSPRTPRALIVEDDPFVLLDMEDMVEAAGADVKGLAVTKTAAMNLIKTQLFDFATIDYDLAGETSEDIACLLKEKDIPFILVSGKAEMLKNKSAFKGYPALEKPVSEQILAKTIKELTYA